MTTLFWLTGPATAMQAASGGTTAPASYVIRTHRRARHMQQQQTRTTRTAVTRLYFYVNVQ